MSSGIVDEDTYLLRTNFISSKAEDKEKSIDDIAFAATVRTEDGSEVLKYNETILFFLVYLTEPRFHSRNYSFGWETNLMERSKNLLAIIRFEILYHNLRDH